MIEKNASLKKLSRYSAIGILAILAVILLMLFDAVPFCEDDGTYLFVCHGELGNLEHIRRIEKPGDILYSMLWHWQHYGNGRIVPHTLLEFANLYNPLWAPLNTLMLLLVPYLLLKNAGLKATAFGVLSMLAVFWLSIPNPSTMIIWRAGSVNYLWGGVGILCSYFIWVRLKEYGLPHAIPIMVAGLALGNCNETLTIGFAFAMFLHLVFKRRESSWLHWMFFLAFVAGTAFNVFSPAASLRLEATGNLTARIINALYLDKGLFLGSFAPILILSLTAFIISACRHHLPKALSLEHCWPLWAATASAAGVNYTGQIFDRSMYGMYFFLLVYSVNELSQLPWQRWSKVAMFAKGACLVAIAVTGLIVTVSYKEAVRADAFFNRIGEYCRDNPGQPLVIKEMQPTRRVMRWNITGNKYYRDNKISAKYFGLAEVTCRTESRQKEIDELIAAVPMESLEPGESLFFDNALVIHLPHNIKEIRDYHNKYKPLDIDSLHIGHKEYAIIWNMPCEKDTYISIEDTIFGKYILVNSDNKLNKR